MNKVAIIGAGAWGTTLSTLLVHQQQNVYVWTHSANHIPDTPAHISDSLETVMADSSVVVLAIASKFYRQTLEKILPLLSKKALILNATKGLELETGKRMSEILIDCLPESHHDRLAVISGPNLAREILEKKPAASVVASVHEATARYFQRLLSTGYFRVYTSDDVIGVELGGILKNIFAIASGISDGFGFGTNAKSALMVRGITELVRLGTALGANPMTFYGLSGIGDLITTCSSPLSRNYQVGQAIAGGERLLDIEARMVEVAEGVNTTKAAYQMACRLHIELPIVEQIYAVLFDGKNPYDAVLELMLRDLKAET